VDGDGLLDILSANSFSGHVSVLKRCYTTASVVCAGDGSATACPCGNSSPAGSGAGCLHSLGTGGRLNATGIARLSHDTVKLAGTSMTDAAVLYFQGTSTVNGGAGATFGDGLRCVGGSIVRLAIKSNVGGSSLYPESGDPSLHLRGAVTAPGERFYQAWYRNAAAFCTAQPFNLTNAVKVVWTP